MKIRIDLDNVEIKTDKKSFAEIELSPEELAKQLDVKDFDAIMGARYIKKAPPTCTCIAGKVCVHCGKPLPTQKIER